MDLFCVVTYCEWGLLRKGAAVENDGLCVDAFEYTENTEYTTWLDSTSRMIAIQ